MTFDIQHWLSEQKKEVETFLEQYLHKVTSCEGRSTPPVLAEAMAYSVSAGGKRLRPILCLEAARLCGGERQNAIPAACAVEWIHSYSLIHDDLPCMDDDVLRRGKPTCHVVYGETIALLAGDSLLTEALGLLADIPPNEQYTTRDYLRTLTQAAGSRSLIGGQVLDLEAEGKKGMGLRELESIHLGKTAALLEASLLLGAMSAGADQDCCQQLAAFGRELGMAFQIVDDMLDCTQSSDVLGKTAGKDEAVGKVTYPALMGLENAQKQAAQRTKKALDLLGFFGDEAQRLAEITHVLLHRAH